jgi:hypothetical protein|tara:strand:+ start:913 stop:1293 length:381 start_codon:yes stop_codon:yes gene_type:complete
VSLSAVLNLGGKVLDKFVQDKDLAQKLKAEMTIAAMNGELKELEAQVSIITTEAQGNWLQRSWRPLTMVWFSVLLGMYWFGFAPDYLIDNPATVDQLFGLLKLGIGGYVLGRSVEKSVEVYSNKGK